jgi:hypothetical protein
VRGDSKANLKNAEELAVVFHRDEVVGVGAIKGGNRSDYVSKIAQRSLFAFPAETPELGYVSIHDGHKGNGLSERIVALLLKGKTGALFATTDDKFMKSTLSKAGFLCKGKEWKGDRGQLSLWIRP